jgi:hypothetical protein
MRMKYNLIFRIVILLTVSTLLQSCQSRSLALNQEPSEPSARIKTNPSSIPVKIDSSPCYITFDNAKEYGEWLVLDGVNNPTS